MIRNVLLLIAFAALATPNKNASAGFIFTTSPTVAAGSTGNTLDVLVQLSASEFQPSGLTGYNFQLMVQPDSGITFTDATYRSPTFVDFFSFPDGIISGSDFGGLSPRVDPQSGSGEDVAYDPLEAQPDPNFDPQIYGFASFTFDVAADARSQKVEVQVDGNIINLTYQNTGNPVINLSPSQDPNASIITIEGAQQVVPEPASFAVWAVLGCGGVVARRRRRS
jgi:hypothetical protein